MSADASADLRAEALIRGCNGFLAKPLRTSELFGTVARASHVEFVIDEPREPAPAESDAPLPHARAAELAAGLRAAARIGELARLERLAAEMVADANVPRSLATRIATLVDEVALAELVALADELERGA